MRLQDIGQTVVAGFFYLWIVGTSEVSFASILDLQRTLFYDLRNFNYSEIANLPMSELYFLTITGPHEKKDKENSSVDTNRDIARESMRSMKKLGLS